MGVSSPSCCKIELKISHEAVDRIGMGLISRTVGGIENTMSFESPKKSVLIEISLHRRASAYFLTITGAKISGEVLHHSFKAYK